MFESLNDKKTSYLYSIQGTLESQREAREGVNLHKNYVNKVLSWGLLWRHDSLYSQWVLSLYSAAIIVEKRCTDSDLELVVWFVWHPEAEHSTKQFHGTVGYFRSMAVTITFRKSRYKHIRVTDCLHLTNEQSQNKMTSWGYSIGAALLWQNEARGKPFVFCS